jgi:endonuclease/exonuclease/phosphatase family metal-dependent hydrolase
VATYNLENYTSANRLTEDGYKKDYPKPEAAKQALHAVVRSLDAEVLAVQEMGPRPYLEEFKRDLAAVGLPYPHDALVEGADEARHIALLSRVPLKSVTPHTQIEFNYFGERARVKRGVLEVVLETSAGDLSLWVVHLKSRNTDRADDPGSALRRGAEATAIRDLIMRRHPDALAARYLILGDFNDGKTKRPLRAMQERGKTPVSNLLPAADSRGERWTHFYLHEESYERVDHILASPGLMRSLVPPPGRETPGAQILDTPETALASDHRPVWVEVAENPSSPRRYAGQSREMPNGAGRGQTTGRRR